MHVRFSIALIGLALFSCTSGNETPITDDLTVPDAQDATEAPQQFRVTHGNPETAMASVLFVGNSLTYSNDLPKLVFDLTQARNQEIYTKMIAKPNYALIDHLEVDDKVADEIASQQYDIVVVQQGPSSLPESRALLFEGGRRFNTLCKASDTQLAFFMVWPARGAYHRFDAVIKNHTDVASELNAILCPVGQVWKNYFDLTGDYGYYGPDEFHPSLAGSQEAARIIVNSIFNER